MSSSALQALSSGCRLVAVDLSGVGNLTEDRLIEMQIAFHRKQARDKVQARIRVLLPVPLCNCDPMIVDCVPFPGLAVSWLANQTRQKFQLCLAMDPDVVVSTTVKSRSYSEVVV